MDDDLVIIGRDCEGLLAVEVVSDTDDNTAYPISSDMKRDLEEVFKKNNLQIELDQDHRTYGDVSLGDRAIFVMFYVLGLLSSLSSHINKKEI